MQILAFLLMLLKIIGIILLCILLALIFILALILLVPIKYNIEAEKSNKLYANIEIKWFIKLIYFRLRISDKSKKIIFKIFGKSFYKDKEEFKKPSTISEPKLEESSKIDYSVPKTNNEEKNVTKHKTETQTEKIKEEKVVNKEIEKIIEDKEDKLEEKLEEDIKEDSIMDKIKYILNYPNREEIQHLIIKLIKRLCKAILPKNLNLNIEFGSDDPSLTGYILAISSILVLYFRNNINIKGNFNRKVLNGNIKVKDNIVLGKIVWALLIFAMAKPIKYLLWKYIKSKLFKKG